MIVSLPLLVANYQFMQLDDMSDDQMEKFISFLVRCSSDNESAEDPMQCINEPPWWLPNLPFVHPLRRPKKITRKWRQKLKLLIRCCYQHHKFEFLLDLSGELAKKQRAGAITFKRGPVSTTILHKNKVLAKVSNDNITYDNESTKENDQNIGQKYYETVPSGPAVVNVQKDVQFDKRPNKQLTCPIKSKPLLQHNATSSLTQNSFLTYFQLQHKNTEINTSAVMASTNDLIGTRISLFNSPNIPFSSQLGKRLTTRIKYNVDDTTHLKRLERLERYLSNVPNAINVKNVDSDNGHEHGMMTRGRYMRKWVHTYKFPSKTYKHRGALNQSSAILYNMCKPCSVLLSDLEPIPPTTTEPTRQDNAGIPQSFDLTITSDKQPHHLPVASVSTPMDRDGGTSNAPVENLTKPRKKRRLYNVLKKTRLSPRVYGQIQTRSQTLVLSKK